MKPPGQALALAAVLATAATTGLLRTAPAAQAQTAVQPAQRTQTFTNPLIAEGADPAVAYANGYYYLSQSGRDGITVRTSITLTGLKHARARTVFAPGSEGSPCCNWWAPEIVPLDGKWYIYVAADDSRNENHRMYVLESNTPTGMYTFKGQITPATDRWAIDGTVWNAPDGKRYFIWSGWEGEKNIKQDLYIARMKNPWTIEGDRVMISEPDQPWEKRGGNGVTLPFINEGPQMLVRDGRTTIVYSASGSWSNDYCLGTLTLTGSDPMQRASWTKSSDCVFQTGEGGPWAPGHNILTTSPDGSETWQLYHANEVRGSGWGGRSIRAQKVNFRADGTPDFGTPVKSGVPLPLPSGEYEAEAASLSGTTIVERDFASGGASANSLKPTSSITFGKVKAPKAGQYVLRAHYSNAGKEGTHSLKVNGQAAGSVNYVATRGWENYGTAVVRVTLKAGENTITFSGQSGDAQLDAITVAPR
ncbi:MAG TPA: family 43 glycosylhydrolase [Deinococcales bacterium]|nr:family 43 glycosylhydrolase [Deinococcales bacterium]